MSEIDIIKIREELGLTQQKFADLIGVDRRTIINYEQGKKIPDSKLKLLTLLLEDKRKPKNEQKITNDTGNQILEANSKTLENKISILNDHIVTLKNFLEEKSIVAEFYKQENARLKQELESLKGN